MEAGVEVIVKISHTLYDLDKYDPHTNALSYYFMYVQFKLNIYYCFLVCVCRIIELNGGQPPLTYKRFQTLISRMDPPEMPVEALSDSLMGRCVTPVSEDHGDKYGVPSLEELGE